MSAAATARETGISEDELVRFVDFSEQRARDFIAEGVPMAEAVNRAADETVELAPLAGAVCRCPMSAPTTAKRQSTRKPVEQCYRFPCDFAYGRRAHTKDEHGHVRHACGVDGSQDRDWEVSLFAIDDGPWRIAVRLGDGAPFEIQPRSVVDLGRSRRNEHEYAAAMLQNAAELSGAISLAVAWWVGAR